ncbi:heavy metal translocating P-type ATPase [Vibrio sp. SM6]|uniref:Copper-exporting P-type ATPase n=1 Tax=Vibrio agarilyticus TaxID=2726741 RepID=A0A7X8TN99_9VIBR|nr:heavy metal translocating P-type ATPase [Vibrio agarilyticus]NLS11641.1 heavy metal translocating P-type ATPase [Vibrio agarilyticus]
MSQYTLALSGLNCMGCAGKVEKALHEQHCVTISALSPQSITFESEDALTSIIATIQSLGFNAEPMAPSQAFDSHQELQISNASSTAVTSASHEALEPTDNVPVNLTYHTVELLIQGMTCASCVASVEKALVQVKGVTKAQINLAEQSALIMLEPSAKTDNKAPTQNSITLELIQAVKQAGYQAQEVQDPLLQQAQQRQQMAATLHHHRRSAIIGLGLGAPLMLWGLLGGSMMIASAQDQLGWGSIGLLCFIMLATAGKSFFVNAIGAIRHGRATMDTLVALGTGAAWAYSMAVVLAPNWFPNASRHVYFEASAMIIGLISLGHYIEAKAKAKTTQSLQALIHLQPQQATQITPQGDEIIDVKQITIGMRLRLKPGEKVPVDGQVIEGNSYLDEAMLTGEPLPVHKTAGEKVSAGTLNQDGALVIEATGVGANTMLARIIRLVREAQSSKPAIAKLADQISAVFVPVVVTIAVVAALIWYWFGPAPQASYMLVVATTVLIIACPCALGLATPLSVTVGIGKAAEMGILIKDADVLQSASRIDTVVFDKTGTLTQGKPSVQAFFALNNDQAQVLQLAYSAEIHSEHPLAKAVCDYAKAHSISALPATDFANWRGKGVQAYIDQQRVVVASRHCLVQLGINIDAAADALASCQAQAWTPLLVAIDNELAAVIGVSVPLKAESKHVIHTLKTLGIRTIMLTGDTHAVAKAIGNTLGVDEVLAEVLPTEKAEHIRQLKAQGHCVAMVGDGINDAPALALADVGIAMGSGSDVAIESAQMTVLNSSPMAVVNAIALSKATLKNMRQNLLGAFIYNTLGIPIAAGALYPLFGFLLSPVIAGAAMALSSITVVSNANRLRRFDIQNRKFVANDTQAS